MNKLSIVALAACAFALASAADAIPYASRVAVTNKSVSTNANIDVTYLLNEAAESVTVKLLDSTMATVATAVGTTAAGLNSATITAPATPGTYRVQIDVACAAKETPYLIAGKYSKGTATNPFAGYTEITTQDLFSGYSPRAAMVELNQDSDNFGMIYTFSNYVPAATPAIQHCGAVLFDSQLNFWDPTESQDGFEKMIMKAPTPAGTQAWNADYLPWDKNVIQYTGQAGIAETAYHTAGLTDELAVAKGSSDFDTYPRGGCAFEANSKKYIMVANGAAWNRFELDENNAVIAGTKVTILTAGGYSKLALNYDGKVYGLDRGATADNDGVQAQIYRWSPEYLAGITEAVNITDSTYEWKINCHPIRVAAASVGPMGMRFDSKGDLYCISRYDTGSGVFFIGNASEASLVKDASVDDLIFMYPYSVNTTYGNIGIDPVGNFIVTDNSKEACGIMSPAYAAGTYATKAPLSQNVTVTYPAAVTDWSLK